MISSLSFTSVTLYLFTSFSLVSLVKSSQGDQSPAYQRCLSTCLTTCPPPSSSSSSTFSISNLSIWPCPSNCSYECTTSLTDLALSYTPSIISSLSQGEKDKLIGWNEGGELEGLKLGEMVQFHGKWPFVRYFYIQELLSVVFSLGNFWAHWRGLKGLNRISIPSIRNGGGGGGRLKSLYKLNAWVGMNAWICSTIFHTRDLNWTEKMDYFSATAAMLFGLYLVLIRILGFYRKDTSNTVGLVVVSLTGVGILHRHCSYLIRRERFDYGYNMKFNLSIGILSILCWIYWSYRSSHHSTSTSLTNRNLPHALKPLPPLLALFLLSFLETFDFQPIPNQLRLLDAHALWHFGTIFVVLTWYDFLKIDLNWVVVNTANSRDFNRNVGEVLVEGEME